jgi:hypothetical protein
VLFFVPVCREDYQLVCWPLWTLFDYMNAIVTVTAMKVGLKNSYFFSTIVNVHIYSYPLFIVHTYKPFINNIFSSIDSVSSLYSTSSRQLILCPLAIWKGYMWKDYLLRKTACLERVFGAWRSFLNTRRHRAFELNASGLLEHMNRPIINWLEDTVSSGIQNRALLPQ